MSGVSNEIPRGGDDEFPLIVACCATPPSAMYYESLHTFREVGVTE